MFSALVLVVSICFVGLGVISNEKSTAEAKTYSSEITFKTQTNTGFVYINTFGGTLYKMDSETGDIIWEHNTGLESRSAPTIAKNIVFYGTDSGGFYAVNDSEGTVVWEKNIGVVEGSPTIVNDTVYVASDGEENIIAYDIETGSQRWNYSVGIGNEMQGNAYVEHGLVIAEQDEGTIHALHKSNGTVKWQEPTARSAEDSLAYGEDTIFSNANNGDMKALYVENGTRKWINGNTGMSRPRGTPIYYNGSVIQTDSSGLFSFDAKTGDLEWSNTNIGEVRENGPIVRNNTIYVGTENNNLWEVNSNNGSGNNIFTAEGTIRGGFTYYKDSDLLYFGDFNNNFYAYNMATGSIEWQQSFNNLIMSAPTFKLQNSEYSDGERVKQKIFGYHKNIESDEPPQETTTISEDEPTLELRVSPYMKYNESQEYNVVFEDGVPKDVTENATVTSDNPTAINVDDSSQTLNATNDENISKRVTIRAEYTNNSETYYSNKSVTVASLTLDNVEILTPLYATIAIIGNTKIQFIIFVIVIGIGGSIATTEYGGIGLMLLCLIFGWVAGWINVGIMLSSFFFALFIFINSEIDNYEI